MSEVRLVVREEKRDWSGTVDGGCADRAVAALSADPVTLEELEAAVARFAKPIPNRRFFADLSEGLCDEPDAAGVLVIDLTARLFVAAYTDASPELQGAVPYHDGNGSTDKVLRYHLADDWLLVTDRTNWRQAAEERRRLWAAKPLRDNRAVFYGRPMLEFVARETLAAFARRDEIAAARRVRWVEDAKKRLARQRELAPDDVDAPELTDEEVVPKTWPGQEIYASPYYDGIKEIHAAWLLTPRDDLGGACPREIALARRGHVTWDLEDRCQQWSLLNQCPPGLRKSSRAFQHAGFGTHELVKYYDLVRHLLWSCWDRLTERAQVPASDLATVADFLTTEVPRLEGVREAWLDAGDPEFHGRKPRSIIEHERARLPETISGHEAMIDPDCPCCQMIGDMPGPFFWHLDGSSMDDEFAFDLSCRTRDDWDEEQRRWKEHARQFDAEWAERKRLGVTDSKAWSRSVRDNGVEVPLGVRVFGVGCNLAELIVGLRAGKDRESVPPETQRYVDQLNRDFGNFRELLQGADAELAVALIDPVRERFAETIAAVAEAHPDLAPQCELLTNEVHALLEPPSGDDDDPGLPF